LGRADSRPVGKIRQHGRADDGELTLRHGGARPQPVAPKPVPAAGQPPGVVPDKAPPRGW
jgi:hypothetical protein